MNDLVYLILAGIVTALACGLGAVPVFLLKDRLKSSQPILQGLAAGIMTVASVEGLMRPAFGSGSLIEVGLGFVFGVLFLFTTRWAMKGRDVEVSGMRGAGVRHSALVFIVLFVHSLPEGMAMGAAHASTVEGLSIFVIIAIALQNVPEGTAVALPMQSAGFSHSSQFWAAVTTSIPQPIGAPIAYVLVREIQPLLAASLAFAGGAMLAVVVVELAPKMFPRRVWRKGALGVGAGAAIMTVLSLLMGV